MTLHLLQSERPEAREPVVSVRSADQSRRGTARIVGYGLLASCVLHGGAMTLLAMVGLAMLLPLVHLQRGHSSPALQMSFAAAEAQPEEVTTEESTESLIEFEIPSHPRVAAEVGSPEPSVEPLARQVEAVDAARVEVAVAEVTPSYRLALPQQADRPAVSEGEELQPEPARQSQQVAKAQPRRKLEEAAEAESMPSAPSPASAESQGAEVDSLPRPSYNPSPRYPREALLAGQTGVVTLRVRVGADGRPQRVSVYRSSGVSSLDQAALDVVRRWRFQPAKKDGAAVSTEVAVPIRFRLER